MHPHRRGRSVSSIGIDIVKKDKNEEENLALFHDMKDHQHLLLLSSSTDLLSTDGDKNDYEWLLTPPETPIFPSIETKARTTGFSQRVSPVAHAANALKNLRLSNPHTDSSSKILRGSLISRPRISSGLNSSMNTASGKSSMLASTGPTSSRSSTPIRSRVSASVRPLTPTPRLTVLASSRPSTPTTRSTVPASSRPSTPTARSTVTSPRSAMPTSKSLSRPSTPTRRPSTPILTQGSYGPPIRSSSASNISSMPSRNPPASRGSSPSPISQPSPSPVLPGFSLDAPPNLRTTMPERPTSAVRGRPGAPSFIRPPTEVPSASSRPRGQSCSPIVTRGRISSESHSNGKSTLQTSRSPINGTEVITSLVLGSKMVEKVTNARYATKGLEDQASTRSNTFTLLSRRPVKFISVPDSSGFGRTLSKKSLDMALRHMDIGQSAPSSIRPLASIPTSSLYSVRLGSTKSKPAHMSVSPIATSSSVNSECSTRIAPYPQGNALDDYDIVKERENIFSPLTQHYSILFKGDEQSTSWLHGHDNGEDTFDHTFLLDAFSVKTGTGACS